MHAREFTAGQKTVENQDRAAGRWAVVGRGPLGRGPVSSKPYNYNNENQTTSFLFYIMLFRSTFKTQPI